MQTEIINEIARNHFVDSRSPQCPECGNPMSQADRVCENGAVFIWHECVRQGCYGQWLEKKC